MISLDVQKAIVKNIAEFDERETQIFRQNLVEQTMDKDDLIDMLNVKEFKDYEKLDTAVRDNYIDAYLKMHITNI